MKNKERKKIQKEYAKKNIDYFFSLLKKRFYPKYDDKYITEIKRLSESFTIRLTREEKNRFCKGCNSFFTSSNSKTRLNPKLKTKEIICLTCSKIKRFKYK